MVCARGAAGQNFLTRGSGRVISGPLGSGRVGSAPWPNFFGSGQAGSGLQISGNFGPKCKFLSTIFPIFLKTKLQVSFLMQVFINSPIVRVILSLK